MSGAPNTSKTQSIYSPDANKSSCYSLPKQSNWSLNSDTDPSAQLLVLQSENGSQYTLMQLRIYLLQTRMHCILSLYVCTLQTSFNARDTIFLLDLKNSVTTY